MMLKTKQSSESEVMNHLHELQPLGIVLSDVDIPLKIACSFFFVEKIGILRLIVEPVLYTNAIGVSSG